MKKNVTKKSRNRLITSRSGGVMHKKVLLWIIIGALIAGAFFISALGVWHASTNLSPANSTGGTMSREQKQMKTYLEEKYQEEFIVEKVETKGALLIGSDGYKEAIAYPKKDGSLRFIVRYGFHMNDIFTDEYPAAAWEEQESQRTRVVLKDIFHVIPEYSISINASEPLENPVIKGPLPPFEQAVDDYKTYITYRLSVRAGGTISDTALLSDRISQLAKYLDEDKGQINVNLTYDVISEADSWRLDLSTENIKDISADPDSVVNYFNKFRKIVGESNQ